MRNFIKICTLISFISSIANGFGQTDTVQTDLDEIVITATRTERKLGNIAVPVTIITNKNIKQAASLRLNDILNEQAGLFLTSGFGTGVQMQGLNPDYTLILLNGEPFIGRTSGVLDLNRITVGNIKKIEIVKGPSSSLYGSEAMAGVINIITEQPIKNNFETSLRYGTYNTKDANISSSFKLGKLTANAFINSYNTDGFSVRPFSVERTVAPLWRLTNQLQLNYAISAKTKITTLLRYNYEAINNSITVGNIGGITISEGKEIHKDFNVNPIITHQFNKKLQSQLRLYHSNFSSLQSLSNNTALTYRDYFEQQFYKIENQTDFTPNTKLSFTIGAGHIQEIVNSSRYDNEKNKKQSTVNYLFAQNEYKPTEKLSIIAGLRFDNNSIYASALSPKLAINYKANKKITINASVGRGFKAPDFRQLYLNFTNTAAGSYSVFGAAEAQQQINVLASLGQIQSFENDFYLLASLKPEFSTGFNLGSKLIINSKLNISINVFRNDIENMIDTRIVANYKNGAQIFSYLNVNKAFTQGVELNASYKPTPKITLTSGYQYLETADKTQLIAIKSGTVFTKDANGFSRILNINEYVGLPNRSKHMANFKVLYEHKNFFVNARAIYRSQWAVGDKDGNGLYNTNDEFANGFLQLNLSLGTSFKNGIGLQVGCDNITNYTNPNYLPNFAGRTIYLTLSFKNLNNKNK